MMAGIESRRGVTTDLDFSTIGIELKAKPS